MSKEIPHDLIAEQSLIACLILDSTSLDSIFDLKLESEDFFTPKLRVIYDTIVELFASNEAIDMVTLLAKLKAKNQLERIGGEAFLLELIDTQGSSVNVRSYARIVKDKSNLRKIIQLTHDINEQAYVHSGEAQEFLSEIEGKIFKLTTSVNNSSMTTLSNLLAINLQDLESGGDAGSLRGIPTGFEFLDSKLLGLKAGQLIIVASRPAMGKTSFALNMATSVVKKNIPVAIFSLEMEATELSLRILSSEANVDSSKINSSRFSTEERQRMHQTINHLSKLPLYIDASTLSLLAIKGQCRKLKAEHGLGLIIIDYLQLMAPITKGVVSREQQISEISRALKLMAKELECPIIALSQLNRAVESRIDKRPNNSDLRESGAIEQDADIILFIYRDAVYNPNTTEADIAEIIIGKNRSGEIGTIKLHWQSNCTTFRNLETRLTPP